MLKAVLATALMLACSSQQYKPTWDSLDTRPLPKWFDEDKFYIFIHWGIFSVPSYTLPGNLAEWYVQYLNTNNTRTGVPQFHKRVYGDQPYAEFADQFKAELWDPDQWMGLFKDAGARGIMFTTKHCDGYTHWKSPAKWNYNSVDSGPHRDVVADITNATRKAGLKLGFYYCDVEWGSPLIRMANDQTWDSNCKKADSDGKWDYEKYVDEVFLMELRDLVTKYKPDMFFPDFGGCLFNSTQLKSKEFLSWLYSSSPIKDKVVVGDRWGSDSNCKHGDYLTCHDRYEPTVLPKKKWIDCMTIGPSWGYNRAEDSTKYQTSTELVLILINNVAFGGNLILNVGPAADGTIHPIQQERLRDMGAWLGVNGRSIYSTRPWHVQKQNATDDKSYEVYYTQKAAESTVFAIFTKWPSSQTISLNAPNATAGVTASLITGNTTTTKLTVTATAGAPGMQVALPVLTTDELPCKSAWVIILKGVQ
jgi:alpha-L-fucosidase